MENMNDLGPLTEPTLGNVKDVYLKASALDKERYQIACLRQEIIDEYEEKSKELLEYLNNMEAKFEHQQQGYEQHEAILRHANATLEDQLARRSIVSKQILLAKARKYKKDVGQGIETSTINTLKDETRQYEWNYQMEHNRAEELKAYVDDLQLELQRAEEIALQRKKRMDQSKKRWELENRELRRKAALGWMLGCLSELYLKVDPKIGGASIMKLVKKVQRELEGGTSAFNGRDLSPKLEYNTIQGELHHLIGHPQAFVIAPSRFSTKSCNTLKETLSKDTKMGDEIELNDQEGSPRRRRKQWQKCDFVLDSSAIKGEELKRPTTSPLILTKRHTKLWTLEEFNPHQPTPIWSKYNVTIRGVNQPSN